MPNGAANTYGSNIQYHFIEVCFDKSGERVLLKQMALQ